jgi:phage shock protein B
MSVGVYALIIIFLIFVLPIWLMLHYRSKRQAALGLAVAEKVQLQSLAQRAEEMKIRILTLERILDVESPKWREYHD